MTTPTIHVVPAPAAQPAASPLISPDVPGATSSIPYVQDALAVDLQAALDEEIFGVQPTSAEDLPDPARWAAHVGQALVEVMHGLRPPTQVLRWTSSEVYTVVSRRATAASRRAVGASNRDAGGARGRTARAVRVRTARVCHPRDDVAEAALLLHDGRRLRAMALRLEGRDHRWVVTALHVG